jgi:hypothetical protein
MSEIEEITKQINECYAMIDHFIQLNNSEEIAYWRKMLQNAKLYKRRLLNT